MVIIPRPPSPLNTVPLQAITKRHSARVVNAVFHGMNISCSSENRGVEEDWEWQDLMTTIKFYYKKGSGDTGWEVSA